jgi:hypothetical protein
MVPKLPKTNEKHGRLSVVRHAGSGHAPRFYLFACDCGGEKIASITDVRRGVIASCGCQKRENAAAMRAKRGELVNDLTGQRFGMLAVQTRAENNRHGCAVWVCLCDCGTSKKISGNHLITGNTASCGCAYVERKTVRPAEARAKSNAYVKNRYRTDVRYSVNRRALHLIHSCLKARGARKSSRWNDMVGYTIEDLVKRLKRTIPKGYTWADFMAGLLHIEHRVPLDAFNFTSENDFDFRRAWALSNLRLLPAADNLAKGNKLDEEFQPSLGF